MEKDGLTVIWWWHYINFLPSFFLSFWVFAFGLTLSRISVRNKRLLRISSLLFRTVASNFIRSALLGRDSLSLVNKSIYTWIIRSFSVMFIQEIVDVLLKVHVKYYVYIVHISNKCSCFTCIVFYSLSGNLSLYLELVYSTIMTCFFSITKVYCTFYMDWLVHLHESLAFEKLELFI